MFETLTEQPADELLNISTMFSADSRHNKVDLGVGVYRDDLGSVRVMRAVKRAEQSLIDSQTSKGYLGTVGDRRFLELLASLAFGDGVASSRHIDGIQTPGGCGALRLAAELLKVSRPNCRVWIGRPTWPNHSAVFDAVGLATAPYRYYDTKKQSVSFDSLIDALRTAERGDVILLHGSCHNPTGSDLSIDEWHVVAELAYARGLCPLVDVAYQGLGAGLSEDATGARIVLSAVDEALIAYSCDKNFGLYRERTGALFVKARSATVLARAHSNLVSLARVNWSMPPDHGAAVVRSILDDSDLRAEWRSELEEYRLRLRRLRLALSAIDPLMASFAEQNGIFGLLPISSVQVRRLRERFGIYAESAGRINIAGLNSDSLEYFSNALQSILQGEHPSPLASLDHL